MSRKTTLDLEQHRQPLTALLREILDLRDRDAIDKLVRAHAKKNRVNKMYSRDELIAAYREWAGSEGLPPFDPAMVERLRLKPVRTSSGVTPVTVLTKPFPCPGECIFCPNDVRMPKSYLSDEPGAQRAEQNSFDPYLQTMTRLKTYYLTGHPTDKIEVIILGGTWSFYPETYQIWFVKRIFRRAARLRRGRRSHGGSRGGGQSGVAVPLWQQHGQCDRARRGHGADLQSGRADGLCRRNAPFP